jgi:hypothetical protein
MVESFAGRRSMEKSRGRWKYAFRRDAICLVHVRNWKATESEIHVVGGRRSGRPWRENASNRQRGSMRRRSKVEE